MGSFANGVFTFHSKILKDQIVFPTYFYYSPFGNMTMSFLKEHIIFHLFNVAVV